MEFPVKATYVFKEYNHERGIKYIQVPCEMISETARMYNIGLLAHGVDGHKYKDEIRVMKKNVIVPKEPRDCSNEFWNND